MADEPGGDGHACLEQRFSPLVTVRTTLHDDGLVVQVARPFRGRVAAVDFGRLVLEPASVSGVRASFLWVSGILLLAAVATCLPVLQPWLFAPAGPFAAALLAGAALSFVAAAAHPRRLTLLLDRERALNPVFLRGGHDEPQVEAFLHDVRRAAVAWHCRAASGGPGGDQDGEPGLANALDQLHAMHAEELLTEPELERFREMLIHRR